MPVSTPFKKSFARAFWSSSAISSASMSASVNSWDSSSRGSSTFSSVFCWFSCRFGDFVVSLLSETVFCWVAVSFSLPLLTVSSVSVVLSEALFFFNSPCVPSSAFSTLTSTIFEIKSDGTVMKASKPNLSESSVLISSSLTFSFPLNHDLGNCIITSESLPRCPCPSLIVFRRRSISSRLTKVEVPIKPPAVLSPLLIILSALSDNVWWATT